MFFIIVLYRLYSFSLDGRDAYIIDLNYKKVKKKKKKKKKKKEWDILF